MKSSEFKDRCLLIIFYRNPELGKVKTRLAATLGDAKALAIYLVLAEHTKKITEKLRMPKALFYSHHIDSEDNWPTAEYQKYTQRGEDLGERMLNSFETGFNAGYNSICIIGTDCFELTTQIIEEAFLKLKTHDIVIGPAHDGGYYLLGMNDLHPLLFKNKTWSTSSVLATTFEDFKMMGVNFYQLQPLHDVDEEKDLPENLMQPYD